jgi:hypothetical protein
VAASSVHAITSYYRNVWFLVPLSPAVSHQKLALVFAVYQDGFHLKIASELSMPFDDVDGVSGCVD